MSSITQMITSIGSNVAWLVKGYLASPVIGATKADVFAATANATGIPFSLTEGGVRIEAETYRESFKSDISTSLILNLAEGKDYISDNIVPHPREWNISGYVPASIAEASGLLMPSLRIRRLYLLKLYRSRALIWFKTRDFEYVQVGIAQMELETRADVSNKIPITITLQEVISLSSQKTTASDSALPTDGGSSGGTTDLGSTLSEVVS